MLKNRDTSSNPYRVPPQPTPVWIKISIFLLFAMNIALIGVVSFLAMTRSACDVTCVSPMEEVDAEVEVTKKIITKQQQHQQQEYQLTEAAKSDGVDQRAIFERFSGLDETVNGLREALEALQGEVQRFEFEDDDPMDVTRKVTEMEEAELLTSTQIKMINKIPTIEQDVLDLQSKIDDNLGESGITNICGSSNNYYRYGSYCYAIDEGAVIYRKAEDFCRINYGEHSTLAIITDQLQFDFIVKKIPKYSHNHWIGVKFTNQSFTAEQPHLAYQNGNQVSLDLWRKWSRGQSNGAPSARDCIAILKDSSGFYWSKANCDQKMNYICQYSIFPVNGN